MAEFRINWDLWLAEARKVSGDSPDWGRLEEFEAALRNIRETKWTEALVDAVSLVKNDCAEISALLSIPGIDDWEAADFRAAQPREVLSLMRELQTLFLTRQRFPSRPESGGWQPHFSARSALDHKLLAVVGCLADIRERREPSALVLKTVETLSRLTPSIDVMAMKIAGTEAGGHAETRIPDLDENPLVTEDVTSAFDDRGPRTKEEQFEQNVATDSTANDDLRGLEESAEKEAPIECLETDEILDFASSDADFSYLETSGSTLELESPLVCEAASHESQSPTASVASSKDDQDGDGSGKQLDAELFFWDLIRNSRVNLAYHVARALCHPDFEQQPLMPVPLVRAAALAPYLINAFGDVARAVAEDFRQLSENDIPDDRWPEDEALLAIAASLRPALVAPLTCNAAFILRFAIRSFRHQALREYCGLVAEFSEMGNALAPAALKNARQRDKAEHDLTLLRQDACEWFDKAGAATMLLGRGNHVWRYWLQKGNTIAALIEPIKEDDTKRLGDVEVMVNMLRDQHYFERLVDSTDRNELGFRKGKPIEARALRQLKTKLGEALDLAQRWLTLADALTPNRERVEEQSQLRNSLLSIQGNVQKELDELSSNGHSTRACAELVGSAVANISDLINCEQITIGVERPVREILSEDLLLQPDISIDDGWNPVLSTPAKVVASLSQIPALPQPSDWRIAFESHMHKGDFDAADRIISLVKATPALALSLDAARLEEERREAFLPARDRLRREVESTQRAIEGAVALSLLSEEERNSYVGKAETIESSIERLTNFRWASEVLIRLREELLGKTEGHLAAAKRRLDELCLESGSQQFLRISKLIAERDFLTANEYLDFVSTGDRLPDAADSEAHFRDDFPQLFERVESYLNGDPHLARIVRERADLVGAHLPGILSRDQAESAGRVVDTWFSIKRSKGHSRPTIENIRDILSFLGFPNPKVSGAISGAKTESYSVSCDPIKCPVPAFGSTAGGRLRIVCAFDRKSESDIVDDLEHLPPGAPFVVLYFSRLRTAARRNLASTCRSKHRTMLLVDDITLTLLCREKPSRLQRLFELTLPFSFLRPYSNKPGYVPPEMFYGRARERQSILDPNGACFIFGGRQLGKSALLRQVKDVFHNPENGHIAVLMDLENGVRIGIDRPVSDIWPELQKAFESTGLSFGSDQNIGPVGLFGVLEKYLRADTSRRILLLLDEADRFLEIDSKARFAYLRYFKEMMERDGIDRRFKTVFAGLHNVQKTTRDMNNPLAHLQDAICVGPLLDNGEWREAQALIERPLASLGYFFESEDLTMPILSKTNYYPSLIQLFCMRLVEFLDDPKSRRFDPRLAPPYIIRKEHVEAICRDLELRNWIKKRFDLTLDLDPKYRFIASAIALDTIGNPRTMIDGRDWEFIRREAHLYATNQFANCPEDVFRALLDEMVGLGVLRRLDRSFYALRSPNVLSFMGTADDILHDLTNVPLECELKYEASTFRAALLPADLSPLRPHLRSPLTAEQVSILRVRNSGVSILFGSKGLGLHDAPSYLESVFGVQYSIHCSASNDLEFRSFLDELTHRSMDNLTLALISFDRPWTAAWVESGLARIARLRSQRGSVRLVFLADPMRSWNWFGEKQGRLRNMRDSGVTTFQLHRWHSAALDQWLSECGFHREPNDLAELSEVTGLWPTLIAIAHEKANPDMSVRRAIEQLRMLFREPSFREMLLLSLGLEQSSAARTVLNVMGTEPTSLIDLREFFVNDQMYPVKVIERVLEWALHLELATSQSTPAGMVTWQVNPVVAALLNSAIPLGAYA
jgi:hypothetical protein